MKLHIAGHTGLVGSALVRHFGPLKGWEVVTAGRQEVDLLDSGAVGGFLRRVRPDAVIVAAGRVGGIRANTERPADFIYENLTIETNLIHESWKAGVRRLLNFGSSCMYPKTAVQPMRTEDLMTGPLEPTSQPYAVAKWAGLTLCGAYSSQYGVRYVTAIPATVYGPGDNFDPESGHVLSALIRRFDEARRAGAGEVVLWGSGEPKREFLYADDLARACEVVLDRYDDPEPINIGSGQAVSIRDLGAAVAEATGFFGRIVWDAGRPDGAPEKRLESKKIRTLGWRPTVDLKSGIEKTVRWYRENVGDIADLKPVPRTGEPAEAGGAWCRSRVKP